MIIVGVSERSVNVILDIQQARGLSFLLRGIQDDETDQTVLKATMLMNAANIPIKSSDLFVLLNQIAVTLDGIRMGGELPYEEARKKIQDAAILVLPPVDEKPRVH